MNYAGHKCWPYVSYCDTHTLLQNQVIWLHREGALFCEVWKVTAVKRFAVHFVLGLQSAVKTSNHFYFYSKTSQMHSLKFILFWNNTTCFGLSVHHQESKTVHTASGICHTGFMAAC